MTTDPTTRAERLIPNQNAYQLAHLAECASPDSNESAGAKFLLSVLDSTREALDYALDDEPDVARAIENMDNNGATHEIADGAPDVYTHTRWLEFVDLAAYNEDGDELGGYPSDLTDAAGVALYIIADRLARALLEQAAENARGITDDEDDEDEGDDE